MDERLQVGIVGCGQIAQAQHAPSLTSLAGDFRIAAVHDASPTVTEALAQRWGARPYDDWRKLLTDAALDVVLVAVPDAFHAEVAIAACEAVRAVVVEKPLAPHSAEARGIAEASTRCGVPVLVNYMHAYDAAVAKAHEVWGDRVPPTAGEFRTVVGPNPKYTDDDILQTLRGHDVDPALRATAGRAYAEATRRALGREPRPIEITAHALLSTLLIHEIPLLRRLAGEPEAIRHVELTKAGDASGAIGIGIDALLAYRGGRVRLACEVQPIKMIDWGFDLRRSDAIVSVRYPTSYATAAPSVCTVTRERDGMTVSESFGGRYETGFRRMWAHVRRVVRDHAPPMTPASDAVRDLELVEDLVRAIQSPPDA